MTIETKLNSWFDGYYKEGEFYTRASGIPVPNELSFTYQITGQFHPQNTPSNDNEKTISFSFSLSYLEAINLESVLIYESNNSMPGRAFTYYSGSISLSFGYSDTPLICLGDKNVSFRMSCPEHYKDLQDILTNSLDKIKLPAELTLTRSESLKEASKI